MAKVKVFKREKIMADRDDEMIQMFLMMNSDKTAYKYSPVAVAFKYKISLSRLYQVMKAHGVEREII